MRYYYNGYEEKKGISLGSRILTIVLAAAIGTGIYALTRESKEGEMVPPKITNTIETTLDNMDPNREARDGYIEYVTAVPTAEPTQAPVWVDGNEGDTIYATSDVNMRFGPDKNSYKIGVLGAGSIVDRLYRDGDWDVIRTGNTIAYVHSNYTAKYDADLNDEFYDIESYNDIVRTTTALHFRRGPSTNEPDVLSKAEDGSNLLDKGEELVVIGTAINYDDTNDVWYLCKARGKIGFVKASYTRSLRSEIQAFDPNLRDIVIDQVARVKRSTTLYNANGSRIKTIDKYQHVQVIERYSNYSLVEHDGKIGMISNDDISIIKGSAYIMDYSDQATYFYCNGELVHKGRCTTGKDSCPTDEGYTDSDDKQRDYHDFGHDGYVADILFWHLWGNQFVHDAGWEPDGKFGDTHYYHNHGSSGCVRVPDDEARYIQEHVPENAARLGHK